MAFEQERALAKEVTPMLMRLDPFRELERLSQQVGGSRPLTMAMDAYRHGDQVVVQFDLPGVDRDSIELSVEKDVVTVRAERAVARGEGEDWLVTERPQGSVSRQLFLGQGLDADSLEAHYDRGVLTVTIAVAEAPKPRRVEITTGDRPAIDTGTAA
jgi:HSP20 family protein